jgi:hypothetical protein
LVSPSIDAGAELKRTSMRAGPAVTPPGSATTTRHGTWCARPWSSR